MRLHRVLLGTAALLVTTPALLTGGVASASFPGASNGNIGFVAICDPNVGQPVYSLNPNGSPPPTYTCPGGTAPNYTQTTAGATDSMPYFSADGARVYFSSNRAASGTFAVYSVPYPSTVSGTPGSQADGATPLTSPVGFNDFAPTVSVDGNTLAFVRCDTGGASCKLYAQSPIQGGSPTEMTTSQSLAVPNSVSGAGNRPEFNPTNSDQIIYVDTSGHIHLLSRSGAFAERDLSSESGVGTSQDEYPDWSPAGTKIILDSNRNGGHMIFVFDLSGATAAASRLWSTDPGVEIEPLFSPNGSEYAWTKLGSGSNLQIDIGTSVGSPVDVFNLTNNRTNNSQPTWQPVALGTALPETPETLLLPIAGAAVLGGAGLYLRRRRDR